MLKILQLLLENFQYVHRFLVLGVTKYIHDQVQCCTDKFLARRKCTDILLFRIQSAEMN
jgi:hypothetical protein